MHRSSLAAICLLIPSLAWAGSPGETRSIQVTAQATKNVIPDTVVWNVGIHSKHKDLVKAKADSDRQMKDILAVVRGLGVKPADVQTGQLTVHKEYSGYTNRKHERSFKYFVLSREIRIKQRGTKRFDQFFTGLIKDRDMTVSYQLTSSKLAQIRAKTRIKAVTVARDKARAMVGALGAKLGQVLSIEERPENGYRLLKERAANYTSSAPAGQSVAGTFAPGAISVSVSVGARFEIR